MHEFAAVVTYQDLIIDRFRFCLQLQKPVKAEGNVEIWLMSLMKMAHSSLHGVIRTAAMAISDSNFQLLEFLSMFPAQVSELFRNFRQGELNAHEYFIKLQI